MCMHLLAQNTWVVPAHNACLQDAFDWDSLQVIMDVGGGLGELLSNVMSWARPDCKGLLLDVQMVIDRWAGCLA